MNSSVTHHDSQKCYVWIRRAGRTHYLVRKSDIARVEIGRQYLLTG